MLSSGFTAQFMVVAAPSLALRIKAKEKRDTPDSIEGQRICIYVESIGTDPKNGTYV